MGNKQERHESRILAVQAVFPYFVRKDSDYKQLLADVLSIEEIERNDFAESLIETAMANLGKIKVIIRAYAPEFAFEKIAPINRAILVLGIAELKYFDTPPIVVINEYIEVAKEFGEERSAAFVNGVLDAFRKNIGKDRSYEEKKSEDEENK